LIFNYSSEIKLTLDNQFTTAVPAYKVANSYPQQAQAAYLFVQPEVTDKPT
jgi:hypothetical protein